ncbi:MAG: L-threonylcarbamoyladenylate synthase [Treponema sp.]|jgi:tRNA threonylcarbamoyl adenosine modification protein (Sua5/YciO/YrdC/YwlC family)|nr:L-threonylcarbamoyladenylate synthase [Treponema sp.]
MIEYVVPTNIDDRGLVRAARLLEEGGLVGFPSDTSWLIGCSFHSRGGLKKLRALAGRETPEVKEDRHFTLLCSDISQFGEFCSMDNTRFRLIKRLSPGPYVFILNTLLGTEKALNLKRGEIGVRLPNHPVPQALIKTHGTPLYSVTAKKSMYTRQGGKPESPEEELFEGGWELEAIEGVDLILDTGDERPRIFTTVLDLRSSEVTPLRMGAGAWPV